jgi:hypothetical protein
VIADNFGRCGCCRLLLPLRGCGAVWLKVVPSILADPGRCRQISLVGGTINAWLFVVKATN